MKPNRSIRIPCLFAVVVLLIITVLVCPVFAQTQPSKPLVLDSSRDELPLAGYWQMLVDPTGRLTVDDLDDPPHVQGFQPFESHVLSQDAPFITYWLRLNVSNPQQPSWPMTDEDRWMLELEWPFLTSVRLYTPRGDGWRIVESGLFPSFEEGVPYVKLPKFTLDIGDMGSAVVYLQVKTLGGPPVAVKLHKARQSAWNAKLRMLLLGLYYGVLLAMILYNLSMFIFLRQISYLWYVLSVSFLALYYIGFNGLAYEFAPESIAHLFYEEPILTWMALSLLFVGFFAKKFLVTKKNSPFSNKLLNVYLVIWVAAPVLFFTLPPGIAAPMMSLLSSLFVVVLFLAGTLCWRKGFKPARLFLLAWCFSVAGSVTFSLTLAGAIPYTTVGFYAIQVGTALEMLMLSLALADRVRILRSERDSYQAAQRRFRDLSVKDGMTGLFNKRYLLEELPPLIRVAHAEKQKLYVAVLDLDNFKQYNDTYGHLEGDKVLAALAGVIKESLREGDLACRFGGEEFIVILPGSDSDGALTVVERIRTRLSKQHFEPVPGETVNVTASIGLSALRPGDDYQSILERADQALYKAKSLGKNRTASETSLQLH